MADYGISVGITVDDSGVQEFIRRMETLAKSAVSSFGGATAVPQGFGAAGTSVPLQGTPQIGAFSQQFGREAQQFLAQARSSGQVSASSIQKLDAAIQSLTTSLAVAARSFAGGKLGSSPSGLIVPAAALPATTSPFHLDAAKVNEATTARRNAEKELAVQLEARANVQREIVANEVRTAQVQAQEQAKIQATLVADDDYKINTALAASARRRLAAEIEALVQSELSTNQQYIRDTAETAASQRRLRAEVDRLLVTTRSQGGFAPTATELRSEAKTNVAQQVEKARIQEYELRVATNAQIRKIGAGAAASAELTARENAVKQETLANSNQYISAQTQAAVAQRRLAAGIEASTQRTLAADQQYIRETAEAAAARRRIKAQQESLSVTPQRQGGFAPTTADLQQEARTDILQQVEKARLQQLRATEITTRETEQIAKGQAAQAQVLARETAIKSETLAQSTAYAESLARTKIAQDQIALAKREELATYKLTPAGEADALRLSQVESLEKVNTLRQQIATLRLELGQQVTSLETSTNITELNVIRKNLLQQQAAEQRAASERLGLPIKSPSGADDIPGRGFGAGVAARFRSGAQFALGGLSAYAIYGGIAEGIRAAQDFEREINFLEQQMRGLGKSAEFPRVRSEILGIARDTGEAASDVTKVGLQLQAAFGGDTQRALDETRSAIEIVRVTGLSLTETVDAFTSLTQNFKEQGVSIRDVGDAAFGLQEKLGVLAKETISFASDLAPVAAQAGFTVQQLEALGAVAQKYSGRSGSALAEAFGRILPQVTDKASDLLEILSQIPALAPSYDRLAESLAGGNIKDFIVTLAQNYQQLSKSQQDYILNTLGGRRETQSLVGVLANSRELIEAMDVAENSAGKQAQYFAQQQKSLTQQIDEFKQSFQQLFIQLLNAGVEDILKDILGVAGDLARVLGTFAQSISSLNSATHGWVVRLGELYLALLAIKRLGIINTVPLPGLTGAGAASAVETSLASRLAPYEATAVAGRGTPLSRTAVGALETQEAIAGASAGSRALAAAGGPVGIALIGATIVDTIASGIAKGARDKARQRAEAKYEEYLGKEEGLTASDRSMLLKSARRSTQFDFTPGGFLGAVNPFQTVLGIDEAIANRYFDRGGEQDTKAARKAYILGVANDLKQQIRTLTKQKLLPKVGGEKLSDDEINDILAALNSGEAGDSLFQMIVGLRQAIINATHDPKTRQKILDALTKQKPPPTPAEQTDSQIDLSEEVAGLYESGGATLSRATDALRRAYNAAGRLTRGGTSGSRENLKKYFDARKRYFDFLSQTAAKEADAQLEFLSISGNEDPQAKINIITQALRNPDLQGDDRASKIKDLFAAYKELLQKNVANANSAAEAARILAEGVPIPPEIRSQVIANYLATADVAFQRWAAAMGLSSQEVLKMAQAVGDFIAHTGQTVQQASINLLRYFRSVLVDQMNQMLNSYGDPTVIALALQGVQAAIAEIDKGIATAEEALKGSNPNVPTKVAGSPEQVKQAQEDVAAKARERAAAIRDKIKAQLDLDKALSNNDPFVAAQAALKAADLETAAAQDELSAANAIANLDDRAIAQARAQAHMIQAQTARVQAQREVVDAVTDLMNSQYDLVIAHLESAGRTVEAAQKSAEKARSDVNLYYFYGGKKNTAEANRLESQAVQAEAAAARTARQDQESEINFLLETKQITREQAIAQLSLILETLNKGTDEYRQLYTQIYNLKNQATDLQFNLPSEINLPTLYEARRQVQSQGQGIGYQDNRQIAFNVTLQNSNDYEGFITGVLDAINSPSRYGTYTGAYPRQ